MRHVQLYESFVSEEMESNIPLISIPTIYKNSPEWLEFLQWVLGSKKYNTLDTSFWRHLMRKGAEEKAKKLADGMNKGTPVYVVKASKDHRNSFWVFWWDEIPKDGPKVILINGSRDLNAGHPISAHSPSGMEADLNMSYERLMVKSESPEKVMSKEMQFYSPLIQEYAEHRPLVFAKVLELPDIPEELRRKLKSVSKWNKIKDYI